MMSSPNWTKLVEQGRAKAYGVSWTSEELVALHELKIPADYVRNGVLTKEDYEKEKAKVEAHVVSTGEKPLTHMKQAELLVLAKEIGLEVTNEAKRFELIHLITVAREKQDAKLAAPTKEPSQS